ESPLVDEGHVSPPPSSPRTVSARRRECERRSPNGWGPIGWEPGISPISPAPSWPCVGDVSRPTPPAGDTSPDRADEKRSRLVPLLAAGLVLVVAGLVTWWLALHRPVPGCRRGASPRAGRRAMGTPGADRHADRPDRHRPDPRPDHRAHRRVRVRDRGRRGLHDGRGHARVLRRLSVRTAAGG